MNARAAVNLDENIQIPAEVFSFSRFRKWSQSDRFPERGRIDFLNGLVEVDLSPENLYTHGVVKTAISSELYAQVGKTGRGNVFVDRTRVVSIAAGLSAEPAVRISSSRSRSLDSRATSASRWTRTAGSNPLSSAERVASCGGLLRWGAGLMSLR